MSRDTRSAILYLMPAFLVMAFITFYPLIYQTYMSFTDFQLRNLRAGAAAAPFVGLDNYIKILQSNLSIPNFHFLRMVVFNLWWALSNVAIHVVLGVAVAILLNTQGPALQALLPRDLHPARRHPADHRRDGLAEHVRHAVRRGELRAGRRSAASSASRPASSHRTGSARRTTRSPFIPLPARVLRAARSEHLAGLAAQLGRRDGRAPEHPRRALRGRRDGRRQRLAEVQERDADVPAAGDAAVRDLRLRHHVQPVLPLVLHVGGRTATGGRSCS